MKSLGGDGMDGETKQLISCSNWDVKFKKCAEKLESKFKYEVRTNEKKVPFYFVYGTPEQQSGNGGRGDDNGQAGSAGQVLLFKLSDEMSKCKIFHKNGKYSLRIKDKDLCTKY